MFSLILVIVAIIWAISLIQKLSSENPLSREVFFEAQIARTRNSRITNRLPYYRGNNYQLYLNSWTWKIISSNALQEMNGECEFCGSPADAVHHVYYPKNRRDLGLEDISFLCVVCKKCHGILHGERHVNTKLCPLCEKNKVSSTLKVRHNKLGRNKQSVCKRCKLMAEGLRDEANEIAWDAYITWVDGWQNKVTSDMLSKMAGRSFKADTSINKAQAEVIAPPKSTDKTIIKSQSVDIDPEYEYKLHNQTTISEAESSFGKLGNWQSFISYMNDDDELWNYSAVCNVETQMADVNYTAKGIALVRNGSMVKALITNLDRNVDW